MSRDEFDPFIERAFDRAPHMADTPLFVADIEARLHKGARYRTVGLTLAGLVGSVVALREVLTLDFSTEEQVPGVALAETASRTASLDTVTALRSGLEQLGVPDMAVGGFSGMQMFWIAAGALVAIALAGAMRLSQDI